MFYETSSPGGVSINFHLKLQSLAEHHTGQRCFVKRFIALMDNNTCRSHLPGEVELEISVSGKALH